MPAEITMFDVGYFPPNTPPGFAVLLEMSSAEEFREKAEECRRQSEKAVNQRDKAVWLRIAESWLKMAQQADKAEQPKRS